MSTFTGLGISRFFLSLRTSALFPFFCAQASWGFPTIFPPATAINIEQNLHRLRRFSTNFRNTATYERIFFTSSRDFPINIAGWWFWRDGFGL